MIIDDDDDDKCEFWFLINFKNVYKCTHICI